MSRALRVALFSPPAAVLFSAGAAFAHGASSPAPCAAASYTHHASLVVEHGDGHALRVCIGFDSPALTGDEMLQAGGIQHGEVDYGPLGKAVCQIDSEPATYPNTCWTQTSPYWVVFVSRAGGAWQASGQGVSSLTFADGDAEGFRYDSQTGPAAAPVSPGGTCALGVAVTSAPIGSARGVTAPASVANPRPSAPPSTTATEPAATRSPGVTGATPVIRAAPAASSLNAGVLAAAVGGGLLIGLLAARLAVRRRRATDHTTP